VEESAVSIAIGSFIVLLGVFSGAWVATLTVSRSVQATAKAERRMRDERHQDLSALADVLRDLSTWRFNAPPATPDEYEQARIALTKGVECGQKYEIHELTAACQLLLICVNDEPLMARLRKVTKVVWLGQHSEKPSVLQDLAKVYEATLDFVDAEVNRSPGFAEGFLHSLASTTKEASDHLTVDRLGQALREQMLGDGGTGETTVAADI
jgi:hypothetical protein